MKVIKTAKGNQITLNKFEWESIGNAAGWMRNASEGNIFKYYINLDERGEFFADVRNSEEDTVFEIKGYDIFEYGWMKHKDDLKGLEEYLVHLGIINNSDEIVKGN